MNWACSSRGQLPLKISMGFNLWKSQSIPCHWDLEILFLPKVYSLNYNRNFYDFRNFVKCFGGVLEVLLKFTHNTSEKVLKKGPNSAKCIKGHSLAVWFSNCSDDQLIFLPMNSWAYFPLIINMYAIIALPHQSFFSHLLSTIGSALIKMGFPSAADQWSVFPLENTSWFGSQGFRRPWCSWPQCASVCQSAQ